MEIRNLNLFLTVYECRNISIAANQLGMNQPAVSKAIRRLESELGVALFEREARGVAPTLYADLLSESARDVRNTLKATLRRIGALRDASEGEIVVGAGGTWQEAILPLAVARLSTRRPKCRVIILPAPPEELVASLIKGTFDMVLAPLDLPEDTASKVRTTPLIENDLVVVGRKGHPLAKAPRLTLEELREQRWVLPPGKLIRDRFNRGFLAHGMEPPLPAIECSEAGCLFQIVEATDMLTFVAELRLRCRLNFVLEQMPQNSLNIRRVSGLILRKSSYLPPLAKELIKEVRILSADEIAA